MGISEYYVETSGCWLWQGAIDKAGYGRYNWNGTNTNAHRVSYIQHVGEVPEGLVVRHACDVRHCVNPKHLVVGTQADNMQDKVDRGRSLRGEKHPSSKLSDDCVELIRSFRGFIKGTELSKMFNVSSATISYAQSGKRWAQ